jgi:outer membrane lipoprotein-sorting protein
VEFGRRFGSRARWAVPGAAVVAVGAVVAGTAVAAGAQAAPSLPARSAAELLADVQRATGPGPMTGTIQETANLGLPSLPSLPGSGGPSSALSLLSGTHTATIWYADPAHVRIAESEQLGETDLRLNGRQAWLWNSKTQTATHIVLPAPPAGQRRTGSAADRASGTPPTPQQVAKQILAAVGPTTKVSLQQNVTVAGQAAYQLAIAPKDRRSLIGQIRIAVDAGRYLPLRVQVFARGATSPAFQVGFTAVSFGRPAASNFAFTPPPGAKVKTTVVPAWSPRPAGLKNGAIRPLPHGSLYSTGASGWTGVSPTFVPSEAIDGAARPAVMGKGWLSVLVLPGGLGLGGSPASTTRIATVRGSHNPASIAAVSSSGGVSSASSVVYISASTGAPLTGPDSALLRVLLRAATPAHGAWGSGRLLRTSLFSVLITAKGPVLVGAVTPSVLYADAAAVK